METIKQYLPEELRHRVAYQPCPTTLADRLYPDLAKPASDERVIGVQQIVGKRQQRARFSPDEVGRRSITVLRRLKADGWLVHGIPFARADDPFDQRLDQAGLRDRHTQLYGGRDALFRGVELFPSVPVMFGTRGHAQMVPFGMGSLPVSAMVHDKLRYFAEDIGRAHWVVDPRDADFEDRLYRVIHQAFENRAAERVDLDLRRSEFFALTLANVAEIYRSIAGECLPTTDFVPYNARERRTVEKLFMTGVRQDELERDAPARAFPPPADSEGSPAQAPGFEPERQEDASRLHPPAAPQPAPHTSPASRVTVSTEPPSGLIATDPSAHRGIQLVRLFTSPSLIVHRSSLGSRCDSASR